MFLAFKLSDIVTVPFGYLMDWLYQLTTNYGWALVLFAVLVKIILLPITAKSKKSSMKMSRLTPRLQAIQKKYANDQQKQSEMIQALYKEEGVSMGGGCLWSFVPLLILLPLYTVVREPITYILHESADVAAKIVEVLKGVAEGAFSGGGYDQIAAAQLISQYKDVLVEKIPDISAATLEGVNFNFLGIDLGVIPDFKFWTWTKMDWAILLPVLSAGSQVFAMFISQKMNNSLVTNEKGVEDKEAAKNSQANQTSKVMMFTMPLMSLWIGFIMPAALSLYWFVQGIVSVAIDVYLTKKYRKIYDAEDAVRLQKALEQEELEKEKERIRAERRAANPDGITENTSKKKLQQKQQREEAAAKAQAAREYAAKKGIVEEQEAEATVLSGIPERPRCKGRAYDPNRYKTEE